MLAGIDDLLGARRASGEWFPGRGFRCFAFAARVIDTLNRTLSVHHAALRLPALELSIEHPAGEDGLSAIAAES